MTRRLIVEADGGSRGNPGVAGYGSLVRDADTGALLAERAAPLGKESNNVAEYTGIMVFLMESTKPGKRGVAASWAAANPKVTELGVDPTTGEAVTVETAPGIVNHPPAAILIFVGLALLIVVVLAVIVPFLAVVVRYVLHRGIDRVTAPSGDGSVSGWRRRRQERSDRRDDEAVRMLIHPRLQGPLDVDELQATLFAGGVGAFEVPEPPVARSDAGECGVILDPARTHSRVRVREPTTQVPRRRLWRPRRTREDRPHLARVIEHHRRGAEHGIVHVRRQDQHVAFRDQGGQGVRCGRIVHVAILSHRPRTPWG